MENPHWDKPASAESAIPCVACDFAFVAEDDKETMPILVTKDGRSKYLWAAALQSKAVAP